MANRDTVESITENIETLLRSAGVTLLSKAPEDEGSIALSSVPAGTVIYRGEEFEYNHGQRPGHIEARFTVRLLMRERDYRTLRKSQQTWLHGIREALTVDSINSGVLAQTKPVSRVTVSGVDVETKGPLSKLLLRVTVRYRDAFSA